MGDISDLPPGIFPGDFVASRSSNGSHVKQSKSNLVSKSNDMEMEEMQIRDYDDMMDEGEDEMHEGDIWLEVLRNDFVEEEVVVQNPLFGKRNPLSIRTRGARSEVEIVSGRTETVFINPIYNPNNTWSSKKLRYHDDALTVCANPLWKGPATHKAALEQNYLESIRRAEQIGSDLSMSSGDEDLVMQGLMTDVEEYSELDSDYELIMGNSRGIGSLSRASMPCLADPVEISDDDTDESIDEEAFGAPEVVRVPEPFYWKKPRSRSILGRARKNSFPEPQSAPVRRRKSSFATVPDVPDSPPINRMQSPKNRRRMSSISSLLRRKNKKKIDTLARSASTDSTIAIPLTPPVEDVFEDGISDDEVSDTGSCMSLAECCIPRYMQNLPPFIDFATAVDPSPGEWQAYELWLRAVLHDPRPPPVNVTLQMIVFLHFYRLDIPIAEIVGSKVATKEIWKKRGRKSPTGLGFYNLPVFGSVKWWASNNCEFSLELSPRQQFVFVLHERQTAPRKPDRNQERLSKRDFVSELKANNDWSLLCDERVLYRNKLITYALRWSAGETKNVPKQYKLLAAKVLSELSFPEERIPGVLHAILTAKGVYSQILQYARIGEIDVCPKITKNDVKPGKLLARGAVGKVYDGMWKGEKVAVKVCQEQSPAFDLDEFRFEVSLMSTINSDFVLPCYGVCMERPNYFYIAPLRERGCLSSYLSNESEDRPPLHILIRAAMQVATGVKHMHAKKIMHRDIKPGNILLDDEWNACIADFGTSRIYSGEDPRPLESLIGTTAYMAPEMFVEGKSYTESVDAFSFGVVLLEILKGEQAWTGVKAWNVPDLVMEGKRPEIPKTIKPLSDLITACWHTNPKRRPAFSSIVSKLRIIETKLPR